jgi:hypothetical protein
MASGGSRGVRGWHQADVGSAWLLERSSAPATRWHPTSATRWRTIAGGRGQRQDHRELVLEKHFTKDELDVILDPHELTSRHRRRLPLRAAHAGRLRAPDRARWARRG